MNLFDFIDDNIDFNSEDIGTNHEHELDSIPDSNFEESDVYSEESLCDEKDHFSLNDISSNSASDVSEQVDDQFSSNSHSNDDLKNHSHSGGILSFKGYLRCSKCDCKGFEGASYSTICQNCYHHWDAHH